MSLPAGTKLGPYQIAGKLGEGGMGEVYRAHDSRLHREVAVKVLPEIMAADRDRIARFEVPGAQPAIFAGGEADQCCGRFSPDGAWIAYVSNESGRSEVFVRQFAGEAEPVQVSTDGGAAPEWHTGGQELYVLSPENRLMSAPVTITGTFKAGPPVALFAINAWLKPATQTRVSGDTPYATAGDRFLVTENETDPRASTINVLLNWTSPAR